MTRKSKQNAPDASPPTSQESKLPTGLKDLFGGRPRYETPPDTGRAGEPATAAPGEDELDFPSFLRRLANGPPTTADNVQLRRQIRALEEKLRKSEEITTSALQTIAKYYPDGILNTETNSRIFIDKSVASEASRLGPKQRFALLDEAYPPAYGEPKLSEIVSTLFPELNKLLEEQSIAGGATPIEGRASSGKLWSEREPGDTPVSFIRKHYGAWNDGVWDRGDLTKPALRRSDHQLYNALAQWERRHPEDQLQLPGQSEETASWVDRMTSGDAGPTTAAERDRLRNAQRRIAAREGKS